MRRKNLVFLLIILSLILTSCREERLEEDQVDNKEVESPDEIWELVGDMDLEEKISQLMIVGFDGKKYNDSIENMLLDLRPGGFIVFKDNIESSTGIIDTLNKIKSRNKELGNIPLFLSIDEEGGMVSRLPVEKTLAPKEIGKSGDEELVEDMGERLNKNVEAHGFNMNNGLILDIFSNPNNKLVGSRAFGKNDDTVLFSSEHMLKGMNRTGVLTVAKHFPGHGDTDIDSHYKLPIIRKAEEKLRGFDLIPFKNIIDKGIDGIMVGHILYPEIDSAPASLSRVFMEDILREELKFQGLIISDDMTMGAITNSKEPETAAVEFIKNGGDLALLCFNEHSGFIFRDRLKKEVESGRISEREINEKVYRILSMKKKYKIEDQPTKTEIDLDEINRETLKLNQKIRESKKKQQKIEGEKDA